MHACQESSCWCTWATSVDSAEHWWLFPCSWLQKSLDPQRRSRTLCKGMPKLHSLFFAFWDGACKQLKSLSVLLVLLDLLLLRKGLRRSMDMLFVWTGTFSRWNQSCICSRRSWALTFVVSFMYCHRLPPLNKWYVLCVLWLTVQGCGCKSN